MSSSTPDTRIDRLYELLPAVYRMRDAEQGYPLRALLRVIAEQVNVVEDDIQQLYENWFVETAEQWAVPYIGDLIGYRPVLDPRGDGSPGEADAISRILVPRREVANTIRYRRRKGTLALLELLAGDVAAWPARAVEFFKLLAWTQNINHPHFERARTADLRPVADLNLIDGPFDSLAHSVDVRRINSHRTKGRYNIPSIGVFVWRLKSYSVTHTPPCCVESAGAHCYTFSVLGHDAPLFIKPEPETDPTHIAEELNLPAPIRREAFVQSKERFYGTDLSLAIWVENWADFDSAQPVPSEAIIPADLSGWQYVPPQDHIAVDPVLGRFVFPPGQLPKKGKEGPKSSVRVIYHYAFSADIGGGEYARCLSIQPARDVDEKDPDDPSKTVRQTVEPTVYRVGEGESLSQIGQALAQWQQDEPWDAVIELCDSRVYTEPLDINLKADRTLQLRAANRVRPVIRLLDWKTALPDALAIKMGRGSRFTMDGLLITGRGMHITGPEREQPGDPRAPICPSQLTIRHCTLVPGWELDCDCEPQRPAEASLELYNLRAQVRIERSIVGSIQVNEDEVNTDPIPIHITDSILDATDPQKEAIGAPGYAVAHAVLTIKRSTVFGIVDVHAVELAENCIFYDCVNVARRQLGCMRFCYVPYPLPHGCRTPRRYRCQPDLVEQAVKENITDPAKRDAMIACERLRVRPQFTSIRYGNPGYGQLAVTCAEEIKWGADDESEMGVFHDLFQPQRETNLSARLEEYTPAGMDVGIIYAT